MNRKTKEDSPAKTREILLVAGESMNITLKNRIYTLMAFSRKKHKFKQIKLIHDENTVREGNSRTSNRGHECF
jgi:hypothetical protein